MANNKIQIKRTSVTGRTPNTTNSANSQYIDTGELALNIADSKLYTSNGSVLIDLSSNAVNANNASYLGTVAAANYVQNTDSRTLSGNLYFTGANSYFGGKTTHAANLVLSAGIDVIDSTGSRGTAGQVLASNGTGNVYWSTVSGGGGGSVNTDAQYTFTNTISFSNTITVANISANGSTGTAGQILTSDGTKAYWRSFTPVRQSYTGDGSTTTFAVSGGYTASQLDVYLNGVKATSSEATISSGTDVVFAAAPPAGSQIAIVGYNTVTLTIASSVQITGDTMTGNLTVGNTVIGLNDIQISGNVVANSSGAVVSAAYVQNTDSRFLSGNLNFTAANVNFTQGWFVGTTTFANTTGMYTTNINATSINATSFTTTGTLANTSGVYPTSNTSGFNLGNTISRWVITANSITTSGNITSSASVVDVSGDVRSIPQNSKTAVYELLSSDNGKHISTNAAVTVNGAVLSTSQVFSVYNNSAASITITQGTGATMYLAGSATTGNRTLAQRGICTVLMVGSNTFVISGSGLT